MTYEEGQECPRCKDGILKKKNGKYSEFIGCDMYFHTGCNFVGKIKLDEDDLEKQADEFLKSNGIKVLKI